ncbi:MAG: glycosyltransferase [Bryobacterales bacterium]|nr:glycosyltransferase [Bryobacterales bacterium]
MTLHIVLGECLDTPPARAVLHLASHALDSGVPCQFYAAGRGAASIAKPIRELAFVEDANDLLLWHLDTEQPQLHLAERFPGIRALLCEASAIHDGKERLRSLTRGFEQVWGVDSASVAALKGLGFPDVALWPVPADHDQWLEAITRTQRLPRTNESASVSVVVCTLNRAAHLESCLLQLRRQRYPRFEVIVVNGPSTDETEAVLARFAGEIKVRRNPIANLCVSRNIGIAAAAGEFVAFLDDDSFAHPDWMCEALVAFDDPLTTAVGGLSYRFRDQTVEFANGLLTETTYPWPIQPHPGSHHQGEGGLWNTVTGNNCLFRRDALLAVGGFDEQIPYTHDESNVVMQMARRGMRVRHRPLAIVHHGSQPSLNRRDEFDLNWKVMVRDSIYCGYRNRPAGASSGPFLWRNLWEHARHRLHDPIDWWLYRKVSFAGFLRIQRQCLHGLLAGAVKALTAKPRPLKPGESAAPFLPWPRKQAPDDRIVVCSDSGGALAEALCAEGYAVSAIGSGASALLDSRRGHLDVLRAARPGCSAMPCARGLRLANDAGTGRPLRRPHPVYGRR